MKYNSKMTVWLLAAAAVLTASAMTAEAQQPARTAPSQRTAPAPHAAAPAPQNQNIEVPQQTTATYGDWVVQCVQSSSPPTEPVCDMAQVTQLSGRNVPFSRVSIGRPEKAQPVKLVVQVPVNASFKTEVHIQTTDADPGVVAPFTYCTPNGCFAEFELKEEIMRKLREAGGVGKLSFADAGGHDVAVPLSFKGFPQAFDALSKK